MRKLLERMSIGEFFCGMALLIIATSCLIIAALV